MTDEKNLTKLEKDIRSKMIQIKSGRLLPKNSGIGKMINLLKTLDETLHTEIMDEYKQILLSKK
jgi:hypothetical protein